MTVAPEKAEFAAQETLAVVGVSRTRGFGRMAMKELRRRGYKVVPVNAHADTIDGEPCVRRLDDRPEGVGGVVVIVPPAEAARVAADCVRLGVKRVWFQQGAASEEAVRICRDAGLSVVAGACILMHTRPAGVHRFHAWLWRTLGKA